MINEIQDNANIEDNESIEEISQVSNPMSLNFSPIGSQDSRFIDLSPQDTISLDRPPRYFRKNGELRSIEEIPDKYRNLFAKYNFFNLVQSRVMDNVLYTDRSLVVSAPTASGKTTIFELAIVRLMMAMEELHYTGDFKIIYMAPIKSLCTERLCDWNRRFSEIGLSCIEVTGDTDRLEFKSLENYQVIITTPEKWDSITRKWKENKEIVKVVKLFMIDEIHLLNDKKRGPTLEAVVSRMKIIQKSIEYELRQQQNNENNCDIIKQKFLTQIRFIALSATIKNIEDIGQWLGDDMSSKNTSISSAIIQEFGEEYRPVQLNKVVQGYMCPGNITPFKFDLTLNYKLKSVIEKYSNNKPTLVFCTTRKGLIITAEVLCKSLTFRFSDVQKEFLTKSISQIQDKKLNEMLSIGIGWHHAGMQSEDRYIVENLFRAGVVPVLLTTSTLSMGVNLPAHLVIIKSTEMYQSSGYENYSQISLQQMIGRAGRPQYDTTATAVIMTKATMQKFYEDMVMGTEIIESNLHKYLGEHLNAEIVLRTITDLVIALDWVKTTFLYVRVLKNPKYYGFTQPALTSDRIETKLIELCQIEINKLKKLQLIEVDSELGVDLKATRNGELMAQYYLTFTTMQLFLQITGSETIHQLINMISDSDEFLDVRLRVSDKKVLNTLNKCRFSETIRFPLPGKINSRSMKINCIIQAVFGSLQIHDISLKLESDHIMKIGERISNCLCKYLITQKKGFLVLRNALVLSQCFYVRLWENSIYLSRQFERIGAITANLLAKSGKVTFDDILNSNPRDLERITNRGAPFGNTLLNYAKHLPKFCMRITPPDVAAAPPRYITIAVEFSNFGELENLTTTGKNHMFSILVGDTFNNILFFKKYRDEEILMHKTITHQVKVKQTVEHEVFGCVISETWIGLDIDVSRKIPPVNRYLMNTFKKSENSETPTSKESHWIQQFRLKIPQLKQNSGRDTFEVENHKELNNNLEKIEDKQIVKNTNEPNTSPSKDKVENTSGNESANSSGNDALHEIIALVFDKQNTFHHTMGQSAKVNLYNPSSPKNIENRNSIEINNSSINNEQRTNLATISPYLCRNEEQLQSLHTLQSDQKKSIDFGIVSPKSTEKGLLIPDSPSLKHYYENISSILKNTSTDLLDSPNTSESITLNTEVSSPIKNTKISFDNYQSNSNFGTNEDTVSKQINSNSPNDFDNSSTIQNNRFQISNPKPIGIEDYNWPAEMNQQFEKIVNPHETFNNRNSVPETNIGQSVMTPQIQPSYYQNQTPIPNESVDICNSNSLAIPILQRKPCFECKQGNVWIDENFPGSSEKSSTELVCYPKNSDYTRSPYLNSINIPGENEPSPQNDQLNISKYFILKNPSPSYKCLQSVENLPSKRSKNRNRANSTWRFYGSNLIDNTTKAQTHQIISPEYDTISEDEDSNSSSNGETSVLNVAQNLFPDEITQQVKKPKYSDDNKNVTIRCCQIYRHKKFGKCSVVPADKASSPESPTEKLSQFKQSSKKKLSQKKPEVKVLKVENVQYPPSRILESTMMSPPVNVPAKRISWRSPLISEKNITSTSSGSSASDMSSPMCMTKLTTKYPNTEQITDYQSEKVSTEHSFLKINQEPTTSKAENATFSIKEKKYIVREIHVKKNVHPSKPPPSYHETYASKHLKSTRERRLSVASSNSRKIEKRTEEKRFNRFSGIVQNSDTFKKAMKEILTQLSDKGALEASMTSQNDKLPELLTTNISDFSVSSDDSLRDDKKKPKERVDYSKITDLIHPKNETNTANLDNLEYQNTHAKTIERNSNSAQKVSNDPNKVLDRKGKNCFSICSILSSCKNSRNLDKNETRNTNCNKASMDCEVSYTNSIPSDGVIPIDCKTSYQKLNVDEEKFSISDTQIQDQLSKFSRDFVNNRETALDYTFPRNQKATTNKIWGGTQHYSNYVKSHDSQNLNDRPSTSNSETPMNYQHKYPRLSSSVNLVRLEDGPMVDLNEINRLQILNDYDDYNYHSRSITSQTDVFNLSPRSFMKTLKNPVPDKMFTSQK